MQITDMNTAIEVLVEAIKTDYRDWTERVQLLVHIETPSMAKDAFDGEFNNINRRMIADFENSISVEQGRKYIKIIKENSVWGFVVKASNGKFKCGDILKAASWAQPAVNRARGNVFSGYTIHWTGPQYL